MERQTQAVRLKMQCMLNKRLYETGQISQEVYSAAHAILAAKEGI